MRGLDLTELIFINYLFWFLHLSVMAFNLTGWIFRRTRRAHLLLVLATALSWFAGGYFYGWGYCFLTDWHWNVLERMGVSDLPDSFVKYLLDGITGRAWDAGLVDGLTATAFFLVFVLSVALNMRDFRIFRNLRTSRALRGSGMVLYGIVVGAGLMTAWQLRWVCDDAFISFRYARNLVRGLGLVFNAGERVEGFTNFLWTVLLAPFMAMGLDPESVSKVLGFISFAALLAVLFLLGDPEPGPPAKRGDENQESATGSVTGGERRGLSLLSRRSFLNRPLMAVAGVALHRHMEIFATSGLETAHFTLLVTAGLLFVERSLRITALGSPILSRDGEGPMTRRDANQGSPEAGLFLLTLAALTRPDGLLVYGMAALFVLWMRWVTFALTPRETMENVHREGVWTLHGILLPVSRGSRFAAGLLRENRIFLLLFVPVWLAKWAYYGLPLPNTFYAKSAYDPYFAQGLHYLFLYVQSYYIFWLVPLVLLLLLATVRLPAWLFARRSAGWRLFGSNMFQRAKAWLRMTIFDRRGVVSATRVLPAALFLSVTVIAWTIYVVFVGGDFMFGRFFIPVTPIFYLLLERWIRGSLSAKRVRSGKANASATRLRWPSESHAQIRPGPMATAMGAVGGSGFAGIVAGVIIVSALTLLRYDPYRGRPLPVVGGISDEYRIYTPESLAHLREVALSLKPAILRADPVVAFVGAQASLIYYWDVTTAIEAETGLTDRTIARERLSKRGRIGHEKHASLEYLESRGVDLLLKAPPPERDRPERILTIEGLPGRFEILRYNPRVMGILGRDGRFHFQKR